MEYVPRGRLFAQVLVEPRQAVVGLRESVQADLLGLLDYGRGVGSLLDRVRASLTIFVLDGWRENGTGFTCAEDTKRNGARVVGHSAYHWTAVFFSAALNNVPDNPTPCRRAKSPTRARC